MALSAAVYDEDFIVKSFESHGFDRNSIHSAFVTHWNGTSYDPGFCIATKTDEENNIVVAVVIRGTYRANDMLANINTLAVNNTHKGFQTSMESVNSALQEFLEEIPTDEKTKYFITGHSYGGAVANLLTVELMSQDVQQSNIFAYTFATPNIVIASYQSQLNPNGAYDNIFNICNEKDPIPLFPRVMLFGILRGSTFDQWGKYGRTHWFDYVSFLPFTHNHLAYVEWSKKHDYPDLDHSLDGSWGGFIIPSFRKEM